jgi:hypothetical protein
MRLGLLLMLTGAGASDRLYKAAWPAITEAYFRKVLEDEDDSRVVPPSSPGWRWRWRKEAKREFFAQAKAQAFAEEFADLSDEEVSRYLQRIGAPKSELRR